MGVAALFWTHRSPGMVSSQAELGQGLTLKCLLLAPAQAVDQEVIISYFGDKRILTWCQFLTDAHWCYNLSQPPEPSSLNSLLRKVLNPELETTDLLFFRERTAPSWSWQFVWLAFLPCLAVWTSAPRAPNHLPAPLCIQRVFWSSAPTRLTQWFLLEGRLHSSPSWIWESTCCS